MKSFDETRKERIEKAFGLNVKILTKGCIRITDGFKRLDLYTTRYFKVDTGERGDLPNDYDQLILDYFDYE